MLRHFLTQATAICKRQLGRGFYDLADEIQRQWYYNGLR